MSLPGPPELGLPEKFDHWRLNQDEAVIHGVDTDKRTVTQSVPTGGGKSLIYITQAVMTGDRTAVLTATKGLQDQLMEDFGGMPGVAVIKGKANYMCKSRPGWTCEDGHAGGCSCKGSVKCDYSRAYIKTLSSNIVITNYTYWIAIHKYGLGLGRFDRLVMDEGHNAFGELANAMQVRFGYHEVEELLGVKFPVEKESVAAWKYWAGSVRVACQVAILKAKAKLLQRDVKQSWVKDYNHLCNLNRKLATIAQIRPNDWVTDEWVYGYQLDPIRPARYGESALFLKIPHINVFSATVRPKTLNLIGIEDNYDFWEYPAVFDPSRSPVYRIDTVRVDKNITPGMVKTWVNRADQFIGRRLDRRGIFHTVSFRRRNDVLMLSDYAKIVVSNREDEVTSETVRKYKSMEPPVVLVSPSITTGYDFKYDAARYQIIGKIPFADSSSKVNKARQDADPDYGPYNAMQQLVQACGRSMRAEDDWCETAIIDDHAKWFIPKFADMAPKWFMDTYRKDQGTLPPPLQL